MKNTLFVSFILVIIILLVVICSIASTGHEQTYPACGIVISVDYETDEVIVEDAVGFQWAFYGVEDYCTRDMVAMIMSDNGTPEYVLDDKIIDVNYSGYCF